MPGLWTIGHSNRPFEDFLAALAAHGVRQVADVRTVPRSRAVPWASGDALAPALAAAGVAYRHFPDLGGLRRPVPGSTNTGWRNASFRGYADWMQTDTFARALDALLGWAADAPTAILCAEAVPWRCHRSLVADAAHARGVEVVEIFDARTSRPHRLTPFARVERERVTYPAERPLDLGED